MSHQLSFNRIISHRKSMHSSNKRHDVHFFPFWGSFSSPTWTTDIARRRMLYTAASESDASCVFVQPKPNCGDVALVAVDKVSRRFTFQRQTYVYSEARWIILCIFTPNHYRYRPDTYEAFFLYVKIEKAKWCFRWCLSFAISCTITTSRVCCQPGAWLWNGFQTQSKMEY